MDGLTRGRAAMLVPSNAPQEMKASRYILRRSTRQTKRDKRNIELTAVILGGYVVQPRD